MTGRIHWESWAPCPGNVSDEYTSVAFGPDGRQVLVGSDCTGVHLWDAATGKEIRTIAGDALGECLPVSSVAFGSDGRRILASLAWEEGVAVWDATNGKRLHTLKVKGCIAFGPDGRTEISGSDHGPAILWDLNNGKEVRRYIDASESVPTAGAF